MLLENGNNYSDIGLKLFFLNNLRSEKGTKFCSPGSVDKDFVFYKDKIFIRQKETNI